MFSLDCCGKKQKFEVANGYVMTNNIIITGVMVTWWWSNWRRKIKKETWKNIGPMFLKKFEVLLLAAIVCFSKMFYYASENGSVLCPMWLQWTAISTRMRESVQHVLNIVRDVNEFHAENDFVNYQVRVSHASVL